MTIGDLLDVAQKATVVTILLVVLYGGIKQWWVFGWLYKQEVGRNDALEEKNQRLQEAAFRAAGVAEETVAILKPVVRDHTRQQGN